MANLKKSENEYKQKYESECRKVRDYQGQVLLYTSQIERLEEECRKLSSNCIKYECQNESLTKENKSLLKQSTSDKADAIKLKQMLDSLQNDFVQQQSTISTFKTYYHSLNDKVGKLVTSVER